MTAAVEPIHGATPRKRRKRSEFLYFTLRNTKLLIGLAVLILTILVAIFGPMLTQFTPLEFAGLPHDPPSSEHWFGTTSAGQDVYSQFVYGMRASFVVGSGSAVPLELMPGHLPACRAARADR